VTVPKQRAGDCATNSHCFGLRRLLLRLRLPHRLHRDAQSVARRNDQTRCRPLQLADRQMGMGRAAETIEILNALPPLPAALDSRGHRHGIRCPRQQRAGASLSSGRYGRFRVSNCAQTASSHVSKSSSALKDHSNAAAFLGSKKVRIFRCDRRNSDRHGGIVLGFNAHLESSA
jgi:hypothetical protein